MQLMLHLNCTDNFITNGVKNRTKYVVNVIKIEEDFEFI